VTTTMKRSKSCDQRIIDRSDKNKANLQGSHYLNRERSL
jgi:hypothetical protein